MVNKFIVSDEKSVYLDTSFILCAYYESIDSNKHIVDESRQILWLLFIRWDNCNCYISNIVINELYNVIERSWFRAYIDKKIINYLKISESDWICYPKTEKEKIRIENEKNVWLSMRNIKDWRSESTYTKDYEAFVEDEFFMIIEGLPPWTKCISNFENQEKILENFINIRKTYKKLDSNDVNHYLLCKEHNINGILTCDSDFKEITDSKLKIVVIDNCFKLYK